MAAEVGRIIQRDAEPGSAEPVTRDFLGGCFGVESVELDLDLKVPIGWEKRLDLQTGKLYVTQSPNPNPNPTNPRNQTPPKPVNPRVHSAPPSLDLSLFSKLPSTPPPIYNSATHQSVCTLEKVRNALERASKKRALSPANSDSSMMSIAENCTGNEEDEAKDEDEDGKLVAGACPCCLLYVLICERKPKCPRCKSVISLCSLSKKGRIDLNV